MKYKVCHFSSVHPRHDTRIFLKECKTLARSGYDVTLVIADNKPSKVEDEVSIISVHSDGQSRFMRMIKTSRDVYKKAMEIDADIYHFHDPELLPYAWLMILKKKKVIYDIHEDVPRDIYSKYWIWKPLRIIISYVVEIVENIIAARLSYLITATPHIEQRFKKINNKTITINNFPILDELHFESQQEKKENRICYIGGINVERGIYEVVDSLSNTDAVLELGGEFESPKIDLTARSKEGWSKVNYHGYVSRGKAREIMAKCRAGIVTFHPHPNHINAQPNKIFEYMSAGLPVIASNFPLWQEIIEKNGCGLCVNPLDPREISDSINYIMKYPDKGKEMGEKAREMVKTKYNWENELLKLLEVYNNLLN